MNILITAGGTSEKIDEVRHLTNHATGSLGKQIATALQKETKINIHYIYGPKAVLPSGENISFYPIHSVQELYNQMESLLTTIPFDYVIHSMAVSDYELETASNEALLAEALADTLIGVDFNNKHELQESIQNALLHVSSASEPTQKKISSKNEKLILVMKKAPKVIKQIKLWQPNTQLIGFKLLVDVAEEALVTVAQNSLDTNSADYILANDLVNIDGEKHLGLLVSNQGVIERFETKKEIALGLKKLILTKREED